MFIFFSLGLLKNTVTRLGNMNNNNNNEYICFRVVTQCKYSLYFCLIVRAN